MGGDHAPEAVVRGAIQAHTEGDPVVLVGDERVVRERVPEGVEIAVVHAPDRVGMGERPSVARSREGVSVRVAAEEVASGRCRALVSCGNSGATLVSAVIEIGKLAQVGRPAIATSLPRLDGGTLRLVDVGTTTDASAAQLLDFAKLGMALARVEGVERPRVGLLSNGSEPGKGNRLVREAVEVLETLGPSFVGPMEPTSAFEGQCDVLVSDGFTGNVLLKTAEAVIGMLGVHVGRRVRASRRARFGAWWMQPTIQQVREDLDWRSRGGALLLGVRRPVVIAHGRSDADAVRAAIGLAHYACDAGLVVAVQGALASPHLPSGRSGEQA